jgi:stress-induced morphogen
MAEVVRGREDKAVAVLKKALDEYEQEYDGATASLYRQGVASVRIRVIDRRFEGMSKSRRHDHVWKFLESRARVDPDTLSEVSLLLTLAPAELGSNLMNFEFENPMPSKL